MIKTAAGATAMTVLGIPLAGKGTEPSADKAVKGKKKILVIGAHPDDPETCAGGVMCLFTAAMKARGWIPCWTNGTSPWNASAAWNAAAPTPKPLSVTP